MKAVRMTAPTGPEALAIQEVAEPSFGADEVRVRVVATALNRADLLQTLGRYPAPKGVVADIPGLEFAGEVDAVGAQCQRFKVGDRVIGLVAGGAWAEKIVIHERALMAAPLQNLQHCAAIPEAFITAFDAMVRQGGLQAGHTVLIHAVASGVGTAAVQICNALHATPIGTGRNADKLQRVASLGLKHSVLTDRGPVFADAVKAIAPAGVDLVLDLIGGPSLPESLAALAPRGTLMLVGLVAGGSAELPLGLVLQKRARLIGTTLRARPLEEKIEVARDAERALLPLFAKGVLKPVVDAVEPMTHITAALQRLANNETVGKTVMTW